MRALDPLLYEKETLQYFQTLKASGACGNRQGGGPVRRRKAATMHSLPPCPRQAVDPMRAAYLDDLRSKFLLENSVLKMEYAEVRVLHLGHKVWAARAPSLALSSLPSLRPQDLAGLHTHCPGSS